jgi:hypothetical protein
MGCRTGLPQNDHHRAIGMLETVMTINDVAVSLVCKKLMGRRAVSDWALSCCDPNVTFFSKSENVWPTGSWPILSCARQVQVLLESFRDRKSAARAIWVFYFLARLCFPKVDLIDNLFLNQLLENINGQESKIPILHVQLIFGREMTRVKPVPVLCID